MEQQAIQVIGGGLAGTEAAWQIAQAGYLILHVRPQGLAPPSSERWQNWSAVVVWGTVERSCRRSITQLRQLGSIIISQADKHAVPAGGALAVDRGQFSHDLTETLSPSVDFLRRKFMKFQQGL